MREGRIAAPLAVMRRWPKATALALGVVAACGFPPLHIWPLTLLALAGFVALLARASTWRRAFALGWVFGVGHFTLANNWIAQAFTFQDAMPHWLGWLAVPLLSLYLAVYPGLAALGGWALGRKAGPAAFGVIFAACWIVAEWLRSWVFTGYAWDPLGLVLLGGWKTQGIAALLPWLGTYALSGLAVLLGVVVWVFVRERRWLLLGASCALVTVAMVLPPAAPPGEGAVRFTLVQPFIPQDELDDPTRFEEHFQRTAALTARRETGLERIVLWPESGVPDYLEDGYPQRYYDSMTAAGDPAFARARIAQVVGDGSVLLTGAVNLDIGDTARGRRAVSARNSVIALDGNSGEIVRQYAKAHLVPYGEYLALRWLLEPLGATRLVAGTIDFKAGPGPQTLNLGRFGTVGPQICYEIVFSGQVIDRANRPDFIFNPSNDGWFGRFGPPQHLAQARMRAIEEGLPVLRSTTTGISAVIDARGIVRASIGMGEADYIDGTIPPARPQTLFARFGNALPLAWATLLLALALGLPRLVASRRSAG